MLYDRIVEPFDLGIPWNRVAGFELLSKLAERLGLSLQLLDDLVELNLDDLGV